MPVLRFAKSSLGAIVDVSLQPSSRLRAAYGNARSAPNALSLKMLIDTGAESSAVDLDLVSPWNLQPASFVVLQSSGGVTRRAFDSRR